MKAVLTFLYIMLATGLFAQQAPANKKTTAVAQRLIAKAEYMDSSIVNNPGVLVLYDSVYLTYSNERHSAFGLL